MDIEVEPLADGGRVPRRLRGAGVCLTATSGGESVGHVRLRWRGHYHPGGADQSGSNTPYLEDLYVAPEHRSQGVGSRLMGAAEELARAFGGRRLELRVERSNLRARALYDRLGYIEAGAADDRVAGSYIGDDGRPHRWRGEMLTLFKDLE